MITQYTAASIVNQNKQLSFPNSVDSIVSSNGQWTRLVWELILAKLNFYEIIGKY